MTRDEQRIAIAEACGWTEVTPSSVAGISPVGRECQGANWGKPIPDYPNDLNAMHEAEKVLTDAQWITYIAKLHDDVVIYPTKRAVTATAAQRAEAFLRTLNLWKP